MNIPISIYIYLLIIICIIFVFFGYVVYSKSSDKKEISCESCSKKLKVPTDYSGKISCPHCGFKMDI